MKIIIELRSVSTGDVELEIFSNGLADAPPREQLMAMAIKSLLEREASELVRSIGGMDAVPLSGRAATN